MMLKRSARAATADGTKERCERNALHRCERNALARCCSKKKCKSCNGRWNQSEVRASCTSKVRAQCACPALRFEKLSALMELADATHLGLGDPSGKM